MRTYFIKLLFLFLLVWSWGLAFNLAAVENPVAEKGRSITENSATKNSTNENSTNAAKTGTTMEEEKKEKLISKTFSQKDEEKIIAAVEQRYSGRDFSCTYHQRSTLKALQITEEASGRAFFSHPSRMRWEYNEPEAHEIITDGITLWIYRPDEKQVVQGDATLFFKGGAGGAFLSDISMVRTHYSIFVSENNLDTSAIYLTLVPKNESPDVASIKIRILKQNYNIEKVTTYNIYGDATEIEFSQIEFKELNDELFQFKVPEGVDVLPMG